MRGETVQHLVAKRHVYICMCMNNSGAVDPHMMTALHLQVSFSVNTALKRQTPN